MGDGLRYLWQQDAYTPTLFTINEQTIQRTCYLIPLSF